MSQRRENGRQERRRNRQSPAGTPAPAAAPATGTPLWMIGVAVLGAAGIAGAVALEMTRAEPPAPKPAPSVPVPMPAPTVVNSGAAQTFVPQPPGEAPPGKVWSPTCGHWHDAVTGQASQ